MYAEVQQEDKSSMIRRRWLKIGGQLGLLLLLLCSGLRSAYAEGPLLATEGAEATIAAPMPAASLSLCPGSGWSNAFPTPTGIGGVVKTVAASPVTGHVYYGGTFTMIGDVIAKGIAKWDGNQWIGLGGSLPDGSDIHHIVVDSNDTVYASGYLKDDADGRRISGIVQWDGSRWVDVGMFGQQIVGIDADDNLYAVGSMSAGSAVLAKWDGTNWAVVADTGLVSGMATDSEGNIYFSGMFTSINGVSAQKIIKWDGTNWSALGAGISDSTHVQTVAVDSTGKVYAGGGDSLKPIMVWDGSSWTEVGGTTKVVGGDFLVDADDNLIAAGRFMPIGTPSGGGEAKIGIWDGSSWSLLGDRAGRPIIARALAQGPDGTLYMASSASVSFSHDGWEEASYLDEGVWRPFGYGFFRGYIEGIVEADNGDIYVAGSFQATPDAYFGYEGNGIAHWNGSRWSDVGGGLTGPGWDKVAYVYDLALDSVGNLYVAGRFINAGGVDVNNIAMWNGSSWSDLGGGIVGAADPVDVTAIFSIAIDSQDNLYATGLFDKAGDVTGVNGFAMWDGSRWSALSNPNDFSGNLTIDSNDNLYVGGTGAFNIWDGDRWTTIDVPDGPTYVVNRIFIDPAGTTYAGVNGDQRGVYKVEGTNWTKLAGSYSVAGTVNAFAMDESGNLYAGGNIYLRKADGTRIEGHLAKWDGSEWTIVGGGLHRIDPHAVGSSGNNSNGLVRNLLITNDSLMVVGTMDVAGEDTPSMLMACYGQLNGSRSNLRVSKTAQSEPAYAGGTVDFTVVVSNTGTTAATNVTLTDQLPSGMELVSTTGCGNDPNGLPICTLGDLGPNAQTTIRYQVQLTATAGTELTNTASVTSTEYTTPVTDNATILVTERPPVLTVNKTAHQPIIYSGGLITYTVKVANSGSTATNVVLNDALPSGMELISSSGCTNDPTGLPTCTIGDLAPSAEAMVIYQVRVTGSVGDVLTNTASVTSTQITTPVTDSEMITIVEPPEFGVSKTADKTTVQTNSIIIYTIEVTNSGGITATNVVVNDVVPVGLKPTGTRGCAGDPGGLPVCLIGDLGPDKTATIIYGVRVTATAGTVLTNTATVTSLEVTIPVTDSETIAVIPPPPTFHRNKVASKTRVYPGERVVYHIQVMNSGGLATNVVINDPLPSGMELIGVSGCTTRASRTLVCPLGNLATGERKRITYEVQITAEGGTVLTNTARITSNELPEGRTMSAVVTVLARPSLNISKQVNNPTPHAGDTITYTVRVTNTSAAAAANDIIITDVLPDGLELVSVVSGCDEATFRRESRCQIGGLAIASSVHQLVYTAKVLDSISEGMVITNTATAIANDMTDSVSAHATITSAGERIYRAFVPLLTLSLGTERCFPWVVSCGYPATTP